MKLEDLKNDIPETPEFIHEMLVSEVEKQIQNAKVIKMNSKKRKKWTHIRVATAAIACILITSTVAYASVELYHMHIKKRGTYSTGTEIKTDVDTDKIKIPDKIHEIDIKAEYIPDGMEWIDKWHLEYPGNQRTSGFSFQQVLLEENSLDKVMQDVNVIECEEKKIGNYDGVYIKYNNHEVNSFNQRIYLLCPDLYRVIIIYIGDGVTKEDAVKVTENLVITENNTMIETGNMSTWSNVVEPEELPLEKEITSIPDHKLQVCQIGDTFNISADGEDSDGNFIMENQIAVRTDSVKIADNLQLLDQNKLPEEWKDAIGNDGNLVSNTLSYIKSGDGINTLDKVVKTETVKQKLVYTTVTYTNNSDKEIRHICYLGSIVPMKHEEGMYQIYDPKNQDGDGYDHIIWDGDAGMAEMKYCSVLDDYGNGGNYIPSLKPGESIQVDMAWIVNENDLDSMYLNLCVLASNAFSEEMLEPVLVDICQ